VAASQSLAVWSVTAGEDALTIGGEGDGTDTGRMSPEYPCLLACRRIPDSGSFVVTAGEEAFCHPVRRQRLRTWPVCPVRVSSVFACNGIPDSGGVVIASGEDALTIPCEGDRG